MKKLLLLLGLLVFIGCSKEVSYKIIHLDVTTFEWGRASIVDTVAVGDYFSAQIRSTKKTHYVVWTQIGNATQVLEHGDLYNDEKTVCLKIE